MLVCKAKTRGFFSPCWWGRRALSYLWVNTVNGQSINSPWLVSAGLHVAAHKEFVPEAQNKVVVIWGAVDMCVLMWFKSHTRVYIIYREFRFGGFYCQGMSKNENTALSKDEDTAEKQVCINVQNRGRLRWTTCQRFDVKTGFLSRINILSL